MTKPSPTADLILTGLFTTLARSHQTATRHH
jgi:hypothetical protein